MRIGAPCVRKLSKLFIRENFVMTQRTPVHSLRGREGNQVSAPLGEEYVINRAMHLCNPRFSWRKIAQEWRGQRHRVQKLVYFRNLFSSILSIRICDRSPQFLVNCFEKIVMSVNNSGLNSTYLLVSEERREKERRERYRARIDRRASEEDSSGKFMQQLRP